MRLVSLNAWGGNLYEQLRAFIVEARADILCLQEVVSAGDSSPERVYFRTHGFDLPQQADLYWDLQAALPAHQGFFCPAAEGDVVDDHGVRHTSRFGLATFVHRDFAVIGQVLDFVHAAFIPHGWGTPPVPRCMHALRLLDPVTRKPFVVAHTHGLRDVSGKHDTPARMAQAQKIVKVLDTVRRDGDPVVFGGDLNLLPDSATFDILSEIGLTDLVTTRGFIDTRTVLYEKTQRYADYLLVTPEVTVIDFDVPAEPVVSDHRPLALEFSL